MTKIAKKFENVIDKTLADKNVFSEFDRACIEIFPHHYWRESDYDDLKNFEDELKNVVLDYIPDNYKKNSQ